MATRAQSFVIGATALAGMVATVAFFEATENGQQVASAESFDGFMSSLETHEKAILGVGISLIILSIIIAAGVFIYNKRKEDKGPATSSEKKPLLNDDDESYHPNPTKYVTPVITTIYMLKPREEKVSGLDKITEEISKLGPDAAASYLINYTPPHSGTAFTVFKDKDNHDTLTVIPLSWNNTEQKYLAKPGTKMITYSTTSTLMQQLKTGEPLSQLGVSNAPNKMVRSPSEEKLFKQQQSQT